MRTTISSFSSPLPSSPLPPPRRARSPTAPRTGTVTPRSARCSPSRPTRTGPGPSARARSSRRPCSSPRRTATRASAASRSRSTRTYIGAVGDDLLGYVARGPAYNQSARATRTTSRSSSSTRRSRGSPRRGCPRRLARHGLTRRRSSSPRSATAARRSTSGGGPRRSTTPTSATCDRHAQLAHHELAAHLDEPVPRRRRHVLRRLGRPELPRRRTTETNIVAGTTITGDSFCRSTNVDYRLDTASARASWRRSSRCRSAVSSQAPP